MTILEPAFLALLAGTSLLPEGPSRRGAASAVVVAGLAIAGLRTASTPLPPGFLAVDGAMMVIAIVLAVGAAVGHTRQRPGPVRVLAPAAGILVGATGLAAGTARVIAAAPPGPLLGALAGVAAAGFVVYCVGRWVRLPEADRARTDPLGRGRAAIGMIAGAGAAGFGPHTGVVIGGVIVAAWSAYALQRAHGRAGLPAGPILTLPLLGAWRLMAIIAGPEGLGVAALSLLPISPAAERLLAPVFLLAAWSTAGLWPLHRQTGAALLAPVGALLLVRIAIPAVPDGIEHWRPLAMPLIVLGLWHAGLSGRPAGLLVGMAWIGLLGATPGGLIGAALLMAATVVVELTRRCRALAIGRLGRFAATLAAGVGGLLAVAAGLQAEVVYTVLAVAALVAAAGRGPGQAMTASDRSTTDASR